MGDHRAHHGRRHRRPGGDVLLRRAARIASRANGEHDVVHDSGDETRKGDTRALQALRELAGSLGARWHKVRAGDPARAITDFAREHQITRIVIGSSQCSRWQELMGGGSMVRRIIREAGSDGIDVHVIARRELPAGEAHEPSPGEES